MRIFVLISILFVFWSCSNSTVYKKDFDIDEKGWDYKDVLEFDFDIENPKQNYNLLINLKYNKTYNYNNLFFFVDIIDSENTVKRDTIECIMAAPNGKWMGEISGDYVEHQFMYGYNVNFPTKGIYKIQLQQAMRDTMLKKISKVGLELQEFVEIKK